MLPSHCVALFPVLLNKCWSLGDSTLYLSPISIFSPTLFSHLLSGVPGNAFTIISGSLLDISDKPFVNQPASVYRKLPVPNVRNAPQL